MSTFSGLNRATTALQAQQRAIDVTGQNIANVNTAGYSRQRAELQSVGGGTVPASYAVGNSIGQGVSADTITRIRDTFLERRAQDEHGLAASLTVRAATYAQLEDAFREPGTTGLSQQLTDMWAGWGDVANNPTEPGARAQVLSRTRTLVAGLHSTAATLDQQWTQDLGGLRTLVSDVNAAATSIADYNQSIRRAQLSGMPTNELADKRDVLVMDLADRVGATATVLGVGTVDVRIGGATLVSGDSVLQLAVSGGQAPGDVATDPPCLVTVPGGVPVQPGGVADGLLTAMTATIPEYRRLLDGIAQQLADQLNTAQKAGRDLTGAPGEPMFDDGAGSLTGITATTIALRLTSTDQLAAASLPPAAAGGSPSGDNVNADAVHQLRLSPTGADASYRKMIVGLGVDAATTETDLTTQNVISSQVDASRESVAGVNLDEEMTNMLQFQHGYEAAGRLVTAIDEMLDTLINKTGLVGR